MNPPETLTPDQAMQMSGSGSSNNPPAILTPEQATAMNASSQAPKRSLMESLPGNKIGQSIGTLGGYLFTELMDHLHGTHNAQYFDISAPTPLQTAADAANALLTAAIPEAGEVGVGTNAAETAGKSFLEKAASAPGDLIHSLTPAGSSVRSGMVLGGSSGALQSVAEGNTDMGTIGRDSLVGGAFGGLLGLGGKALGSLADSERAATGITPQVKNILKTATPEELSQNINAAVEHGQDVTKPNPYGLSQDKLEQAGSVIKNKLNSAKQAIGAVLQNEGKAPVSLAITDPVTGQETSVLDQFKQRVKDMFGHDIVDDFPIENTNKKPSSFVPKDPMQKDLANYMDSHGSEMQNDVSLSPVEGDGRKISGADEKRIIETYQDLKRTAGNPTLRTTNSTIDNIGYQENKGFGVTPDKVDSLLNSTRHDLNEAAKTSNPLYAAAKSRAQELHQMDDLLGEQAGPQLNKGQLLMRRVFYGDQNAGSIALLSKIKDETGIDLIKQAGLAKFAIENFGDESQKTGLRQALSGGAKDAQALSGFPSKLIGAATRHLTDFFSPDAEKMAVAITKGGDYKAGAIGNMIDNILEKPQMQTFMKPITEGFKQMGAGRTSDAAATAAKKFLKIYLINRLSQPANVVNGTPPVTGRNLTQ